MPRTAIPAPRHPAEPTAPPVERMLLTVEEAAAAIGVGRSLMYELIGRAEIRTVRVGRLRRLRPDDLRHYVASLGACSPLSSEGDAELRHPEDKASEDVWPSLPG